MLPDDQLTNLVTDNGNLQFTAPYVGCQAHAIAFDPSDGNRIVVGTEANGVIATVNGGQSWFRVPNTQQITAVSDFFFDEVRNVLYVASYGRGLWKIVGITAQIDCNALIQGIHQMITTGLKFTVAQWTLIQKELLQCEA